jgi:hypothetical protein
VFAGLDAGTECSTAALETVSSHPAHLGGIAAVEDGGFVTRNDGRAPVGSE